MKSPGNKKIKNKKNWGGSETKGNGTRGIRVKILALLFWTDLREEFL